MNEITYVRCFTVFGRKDLQKPDVLNARKLRTQFYYALLMEFWSNHAKNRVCVWRGGGGGWGWGACGSLLVFLRFKNLKAVVSFWLETIKNTFQIAIIFIGVAGCLRCNWFIGYGSLQWWSGAVYKCSFSAVFFLWGILRSRMSLRKPVTSMLLIIFSTPTCDDRGETHLPHNHNWNKLNDQQLFLSRSDMWCIPPTKVF